MSGTHMVWFVSLSVFVGLAVQVSGQRAPFEAREATIFSVHTALFSGSSTCREVVSAFLARIEAYNPLLNAIITLDHDALRVADSLDESFKRGNASGPLFCIPILLKDNFDAVGLPTTAGCLALNSTVPVADASTVTAFRDAGAVILGKTNLHELALEGLSVSSLAGQTINPYDFTRTPGGSSGGTGAAIAASFAVLGTGTDTVNSLRSPASANSLYSFRPTRGLISRDGVVPVSYTQDTVGAIGRSLLDIAVAFNVMASANPTETDNVTSTQSQVRGADYATSLSEQNCASLPELRIGVLHPFFNYTPSNETTPVNTLLINLLNLLSIHNTTLVHLNDTTTQATYNMSTLMQLDVQQYEYREQLTSYLSSPKLQGPRPSSMPDLYLNTTQYLVIPAQYPYIRNALQHSTSSPGYTRRLTSIRQLTQGLHQTIQANNLDAIIYPEQRTLVVPIGSINQAGRNGILAALTGSPVITVPIGFSEASDTAPIGIPVGLEILGAPRSEGKMFGVAKRIDDLLHARRSPVTGGIGEGVDVREYQEVPVIRPTGLTSRGVAMYPRGVF